MLAAPTPPQPGARRPQSKSHLHVAWLSCRGAQPLCQAKQGVNSELVPHTHILSCPQYSPAWAPTADRMGPSPCPQGTTIPRAQVPPANHTVFAYNLQHLLLHTLNHL